MEKTRANFFHHRGDIVNSRRSFAHCASIMKMGKVLARETANNYPEMLQSGEFAQKPPIGSVFFYDTSLNRYIFNVVMKENFYDKLTYYTLSVALHTLRFVILTHNILSLNYQNLDVVSINSEKSVLRQIIEVFSYVPVEIHLYNYNTATN